MKSLIFDITHYDTVPFGEPRTHVEKEGIFLILQHLPSIGSGQHTLSDLGHSSLANTFSSSFNSDEDLSSDLGLLKHLPKHRRDFLDFFSHSRDIASA